MTTPVSQSIYVKGLTKVFQTFDRREGITGAFRDLFYRNYRPFVAVDKIDFSVNSGELIGYLGPNGAGKSTSIKMLTGILQPTAGDLRILGYHPFQQRKEYVQHIGVVFGQRTQLWWDIAVIESFRLLGRIYGVPKGEFEKRLQSLIEVLEIEEILHTPTRKLSLGQRIRCDLAASLIHQPQILFLDEPTIGLDAVAKDSVRRFLKKINHELKTTVLLTTHDLKEIEELCQRIIILDHGRIVFDGSLERIRSLPGLEKRMVVDFRTDVTSEQLSSLCDGVLKVQLNGSRAEIRFPQDKIPAVELLREVISKFDILDLTLEEPDIEQIIMRIYREGISEERQEVAA
jgi:ABC-2 type transport system ATP-binding protein